jgi:hypothetical protein
MAEHEHPFAGPTRAEHDLDLGDGHWLDWSTYEGERCGGIITHVRSDADYQKVLARLVEAESVKNDDEVKEFYRYCQGSFTIAGSKWAQKHPGTVWSWNGEVEQPTLSPSFLCHCGDHGFVVAGRWERV